MKSYLDPFYLTITKEHGYACFRCQPIVLTGTKSNIPGSWGTAVSMVMGVKVWHSLRSEYFVSLFCWDRAAIMPVLLVAPGIKVRRSKCARTGGMPHI